MVANTKERITARLNEAFRLIEGLSPGPGQHQRIASKFKVSRETARKWVQGDALPELWRIVEIGNRSGLGACYLLLDERHIQEAPQVYGAVISEVEMKMVGALRSANETGQNLILATAQALARDHQRKALPPPKKGGDRQLGTGGTG